MQYFCEYPGKTLDYISMIQIGMADPKLTKNNINYYYNDL